VTLSALLLVFLAVFIGAFIVGVSKARSKADGFSRNLHSRPGYYGGYLALWATLPALFLALVWSAAAPAVIDGVVRSELPEAVRAQSTGSISLVMGTIRSVAQGLPTLTTGEREEIQRNPKIMRELLGRSGVVLAADPQPFMIAGAERLITLSRISRMIMTGLAAILMLGGFAYAIRRISRELRARNLVENITLAGLIAASTVAILTTAGIVFSVLFESLQFFQSVSIWDFLFGTVWDPRFSAPGRSGGAEGQFGLLPLLWGTLFISAIALAVAVPLGLFSAVYMAEYAAPRTRAIAKPLLEVLAGIPTIVYGFFALATVGPFLRDIGAVLGLDIAATSVLGAGLVMGIMIIPFVSSLSDDIIGSVPQALREGSYGLGATKSETIKRVVLPAALPGIVGAVLLAGSRAVGETMIVVLAAGIAANLTFNPFESVTTITVKIVSQLTGDLQFDTPQTLVAFALGLTLFLVTLALNIYALYIVRKYREAYQ
jgi:phosphate transport system permease protein